MNREKLNTIYKVSMHLLGLPTDIKYVLKPDELYEFMKTQYLIRLTDHGNGHLYFNADLDPSTTGMRGNISFDMEYSESTNSWNCESHVDYKVSSKGVFDDLDDDITELKVYAYFFSDREILTLTDFKHMYNGLISDTMPHKMSSGMPHKMSSGDSKYGMKLMHKELNW